MAIAGIILLMARYRAINLKFAENWEEDYQLGNAVDQVESEQDEVEESEEQTIPLARSDEEAEAEAAKIRMDKLLGRRRTKAPPAKKSS
jgi:hypothetical protein